MELTMTAGCWMKFCSHLTKMIWPVCFITHLINKNNVQLLPLLRQFLLIPNRINKSMDLRACCCAFCLNQFCWDLISTWCFMSSQLSNSQLKLTGTSLILPDVINLLTPNVNYSGRTAPLTSKVAFYIFIQQIQVLNISNMVYTLHFFFPLQNAVCFIILTYLVPVLFTFYILKFKK